MLPTPIGFKRDNLFHYFLLMKSAETIFIFLPAFHLIVSLLICTLISENQGLEKSRSVSNLRKISGPAHLDFFSVCHLDFFQVYAFFLGGDLEKNPGLQDLM